MRKKKLLYPNVRICENPRPQQKGYYKQDWDGASEHINEIRYGLLTNSMNVANIAMIAEYYNLPLTI